MHLDIARNLAVLGVIFLFLVGCSNAKRSSEVQAAYVPTMTYSGMSCDALCVEANRVRQVVAGLEAETDAAYEDDKKMEAVTWLLFWPAVFAMDGNSAEVSRLSQARGEAEAIRAAMIEKNCGSVVAPEQDAQDAEPSDQSLGQSSQPAASGALAKMGNDQVSGVRPADTPGDQSSQADPPTAARP